MATHDLLAKLIKSHKMTPHQFALKAGIRGQALSDILAGEKEGTSRERVSIARALNLEVDDLFVMPTPEVDLNPDWLRTRDTIRQWPQLARDRFLTGMLQAAVTANHGLVSMARDYDMRAGRAGLTIDTDERQSINKLTAEKGYRNQVR